jgi:hypothetical protein
MITSMFGRRGEPTKQLRSSFLVLALLGLTRTLLSPLIYLGNCRGRGDCLIAVAQVTNAKSG